MTENTDALPSSYQDTLNKAALALHQALDVNLTIEIMLDCLQELIPYDSASVMLLDGEGFLVIQDARGYEHWLPDSADFKGIAFPIQKTTLPINAIYQNQQSALIPDVREEPGWQSDIGAGAIIRSWIGIPLIAGGRFIGLISLDKMELDVFTQDHIRLGEHIAAHAALAIQNAQLFQAEQTNSNKLQQSQAILYQADKAAALSRLTTTISHEINNPIQAIQGCLSLTRDEIDRAGSKENIDRYLDVIEFEANRITTIINEMRNSHLTVNNQSHQPCDINTILDTILRENEKQINAKQIAMQRSWTENLPLIHADKTNLTLAFHNVIVNTIEAMEPYGRLALKTTLYPPPVESLPPAIQITINNPGQLIPADIRENLFESFTNSQDNQFGLGLFISYSIIEAHGGKMTAASTAEQGTTFTIHIPVPSLPATGKPD